MILCGNARRRRLDHVREHDARRRPTSVWREGSWKGLADWEREMPAHYATAQRMLGVTENQILGDADHDAEEDGRRRRASATRSTRPTSRSTSATSPAQPNPDPYFGGEGPARSRCIGCGGCMVGCRFNAKNTLDKNYLYFAEKRGAKVLAETRVVDVAPARRRRRRATATRSTIERSTARLVEAAHDDHRAPRRARGVRARHDGPAPAHEGARRRCPTLSDRLGSDVRTNSESILGVRFPGAQFDMSKGIAIGSGIHIDRFTHIEATRYSRGSDVLGLIATMLVTGKGWRRICAWIGSAFRHPIKFARAGWPFGFARQTLILLVMQTIDATLRFRLRRRWFWPFTRLLSTDGQRIPTNIPQANAFAERAAAEFGGIAITSTTEILFDMPMTAHCIGGCVMGADAEHGVIDAQHRVFGYQNLLRRRRLRGRREPRRQPEPRRSPRSPSAR